MLDVSVPEFSVKNNVTFYDGENYYQAHINNVSLNHLTNAIEYRIFYRTDPSSNGFMKTTAHPHEIKESVHFKEPV